MEGQGSGLDRPAVREGSGAEGTVRAGQEGEGEGRPWPAVLPSAVRSSRPGMEPVGPSGQLKASSSYRDGAALLWRLSSWLCA